MVCEYDEKGEDEEGGKDGKFVASGAYAKVFAIQGKQVVQKRILVGSGASSEMRIRHELMALQMVNGDGENPHVVYAIDHYYENNNDDGKGNGRKKIDVTKRFHINIPISFTTDTRTYIIELSTLCIGSTVCKDLFEHILEASKTSGIVMSTDLTNALSSQLFSALLHCHDKGVAHMDVKPENIVVDAFTPRLLLVDFGLAKICPRDANGIIDSRAKVVCGSISFTAPEVLQTFPSRVCDNSLTYDAFKADVWSSGVVIFMMTNAFNAFDGGAKPGTVSMNLLEDCSIFNISFTETINFYYSRNPCIMTREMRTLLDFVLVSDPEKRPSVSECIEKMKVLNIFSFDSTRLGQYENSVKKVRVL